MPLFSVNVGQLCSLQELFVILVLVITVTEFTLIINTVTNAGGIWQTLNTANLHLIACSCRPTRVLIVDVRCDLRIVDMVRYETEK